jgi:predicted nucleotidyltransferase
MIVFFSLLAILSYYSGVLYLRDTCGRCVLNKITYSSIAISKPSTIMIYCTSMKYNFLTANSLGYIMIFRGGSMNQLLKVVRENLGLTQSDISKLIGIPINTIRNWEQETRTPSEWTLNLLIDRILRESYEKQNVVDESIGILSFLTIKKNVSKIAEKYDIDCIYLFGSYIKGQATEDSDVDLYMKSNLYGLEYFEFVEELREALKKKVEVLSNKTVEEHSKIEEEINKTGVLIYER